MPSDRPTGVYIEQVRRARARYKLVRRTGVSRRYADGPPPSGRATCVIGHRPSDRLGCPTVGAAAKQMDRPSSSSRRRTKPTASSDAPFQLFRAPTVNRSVASRASTVFHNILLYCTYYTTIA